MPAEGLDAIVFGAGSLWGTDGDGGRVWRIDIGQPGRRPTMQTVAMAPGVRGIAFEPHGVWVTNLFDDTVSRIDPATNRVSRVIHMPAAPRDLAIGEGRVWVTLAGANDSPAAATSARPGRLAGVRGADCRPVVFAGTGQPDALVVSDLPLQGPVRADTLPMSQAVALTLKRHGFRAGRFSVGYQSCDDSTAEAGFSDEQRCRRNPRAYAAEPRVVGIIGAVRLALRQPARSPWPTAHAAARSRWSAPARPPPTSPEPGRGPRAVHPPSTSPADSAASRA